MIKIEETIICEHCKKIAYDTTKTEIINIINNSSINLTYETTIDILGDLLIQWFKNADNELTKKYATEVINCVVDNTINKK